MCGPFVRFAAGLSALAEEGRMYNMPMTTHDHWHAKSRTSVLWSAAGRLKASLADAEVASTSRGTPSEVELAPGLTRQ